MSTRYKVTLVNGDGSHEDSFSAAAGRHEKAAAMLYQAADKLEREEKYEYAVKWLDENSVANNMGEHR